MSATAGPHMVVIKFLTYFSFLVSSRPCVKGPAVGALSASLLFLFFEPQPGVKFLSLETPVAVAKENKKEERKTDH